MKLGATNRLYFDKNRPTQNGTCSVKLVVSFNRKRKYYATGYRMGKQEFEKIQMNKNLGKKNNIKLELQEIIHKSNKAINNLPYFTFENFEKIFFDQRKISNDVFEHFDIYIERLEVENRLNTASSYKSAKNKFKKYKNNICFGDVTVDFLCDFEKWMLSHSLSKTTVGIYIRSLRAIYNTQGFSQQVSPFGFTTGKYKIPKGNNTKKALDFSDLKAIKSFQTSCKTSLDRSIDIWIFLFQAGGMNFIDMCNLTWSNVTENNIVFKRKKTLNRTSDDRDISIPLTKHSKIIIEKWGTDKKENSYVFPFFCENISEKQKISRKESLLKKTNEHLSEISNLQSLNQKVTTGFARHTFATILINAGISKDKVSFYMGHKPLGVTEYYINRQNNNDDIKAIEILEKALEG